MIDLLTRFRPSLPPVAVLVETPSILALRATKSGKGVQPLVKHEEAIEQNAEGAPLPEGGWERLSDALLTRLGRPKRISLLMGDPFFRMQVLTLNDFPRKEDERKQVIMWHLRKNLNMPVENFRLRYEVLRRVPGAITLWLTLCQEEAVLALEKTFAEAGCEVGLIGAVTPTLHNLILARGFLPDEGPALLLNRTPSYLSFLFTEGGTPVFFRCKESPPDDDGSGGRIEQEIRLTLAYLREKLGYGPLKKVFVRRHPVSLTLPLEETIEEDVPIVDIASESGLGGDWDSAWLPLAALLEGN